MCLGIPTFSGGRPDVAASKASIRSKMSLGRVASTWCRWSTSVKSRPTPPQKKSIGLHGTRTSFLSFSWSHEISSGCIPDSATAASAQTGASDAAREGVLNAAVAFNQVAAELGSFRAESIDCGDVWRRWERHVDPRGRVDWRLLDNLRKLGVWLRDKGLSKDAAHALIGKYVYLRYLRDREILSNRKFEEWGLDPAKVFGQGATVAGLRAVIRNLEGWLNGSVFPLKLTGAGSPSAEHIVEGSAGLLSGTTLNRGSFTSTSSHTTSPSSRSRRYR